MTKEIRTPHNSGTHLRAIILAGIGVISAAPAYAASSSAYGIEAQFMSADLSTGIGPIAFTQGSTPPSYAKAASVGKVNQIVNVVPGVSPTPALFVNANGLKSHVSGGFGIDVISSQGNTSLRSANLSLMLNPPPPVNRISPQPEPFLALSTTGIKSSTFFNEQVPRPATTGGDASFSSITITGSLVADKTLRFSGDAAKNTILYKSPTSTSTDVPAITITLNKQVAAAVISCPVNQPSCTATPAGLTVDAVSIDLHNADLNGHPVTGTITLGHQSASQ